MPDYQNKQLSSMLEDLQSKLLSCDDIQERASLRAAIKHLRASQDLLNPGSNLRRSRRKYILPDRAFNNKQAEHAQTIEKMDDIENRSAAPNSPSVFASVSVPPARINAAGAGATTDKETTNSIEKRLHIPLDSVSFRFPSPADPSETKNLIREDVSSDYGLDSSKRRSRPSLSHILKLKSPKSSKNPFPDLSSPSASEDKEESSSFGRRRFSKRFRKRTNKSAIDTAEPTENNVNGRNLLFRLSSDAEQLDRRDQFTRDSNSATSESLASSAQSDSFPSATDFDKTTQNKYSARDTVKRVINRIFPVKQNKHAGQVTESKTNPPGKESASVSPCNGTFLGGRPSAVLNHSIKSVSSPSNKEINDAKASMAEMLLQPHDVAAQSDSKKLPVHNSDVTNLKEPLQSSLIESKESKERNNSNNHNRSSSDITADLSTDFVKANEKTCLISSKETSFSDESKVVDKSSAEKVHLTSSSNSPWAPEQAKKSSFRSVRSSTPTARPPTQTAGSAPSEIKSEIRKQNSPAATPKSFNQKLKPTPSRFGNREYSASFRSYRPTTYKPPEHVRTRAESFRLSRPKDFIKQVTPDKPCPVEQVARSPVGLVDHSSSTPRSSSSVNKFPSDISPVHLLSATSRTSSLQRSQSCKENQKRIQEASPNVFNGPASKTHSQRILSRVLSLRIDSEKAHQRRLEGHTKSLLTSKDQNQLLLTNPSTSAENSPTSFGQAKSLSEEENCNVVELPSQDLVKSQIISSNVGISDDLCKNSVVVEEVEDSLINPPTLLNSDQTEADYLKEAKFLNQPTEIHQSLPFDFLEYLGELIEKVDSIVNQNRDCDKDIFQLEEEQIKSSLQDCVNSTVSVSKTSIDSVEADLPTIAQSPEDLTYSSTSDSSVPAESNFLDHSAVDVVEELKVTSTVSSVNISNSKDPKDEEEMEGRSVLSSRGSSRQGSVKSRILASESWITTSGKGSEMKKTRQADARMFRNTEGIRSRMNKFSTNSSPSTTRTISVKSSDVTKRPDDNNNINGNVLEYSTKVETNFSGRSITPQPRVKVEKSNEITQTKLIVTNGFPQDSGRQSPARSVQITSINMSKNVRIVGNSSIKKTDKTNSTKVLIAPSAAKANDVPQPQDDVKKENGIFLEAAKVKDCATNGNTFKVIVRPTPASSVDTNSNSILQINSISKNDSGPLPRSPPSQSPHDDVVEEKSHRANSRSTRTRRLRSSKDAVSAAAPSADAPGSPAETGAGPGNGERVDNSSTLDVPVTAPRRRRRIRKSSEKTSASNSTPTTPDREGVSSKFADEKPTTPSSPRTPDKVVAQDLKSPKGGSPKPTAIVPEMSAEKKQDNVRVTPIAVESSRDATKAKAIRGVTTRSSENNGATMTSERTLTESKPVNSTKKNQPGIAATRNLPPAPEAKVVEKVIKEDPKEMAPLAQPKTRYTLDNVEECTDESILKKMLDEVSDFEGRSRIRAVLRALKKRKEESLDKSKTTNSSFTWSSQSISIDQTCLSRSRSMRLTDVRFKSTAITSNTPTSPFDTNSLANKYLLKSTAPSSGMSSGSKKIGSIFDREEEPPNRSFSRINPTVDRKRDIVRNRSMPSASSKDARKMFIAKLEGDGGNKTGSKKIGRSPTFVVPNANNVKQMLLKWCQSKTRAYDNVDITNFSGSWANGLAFCALVHNFFPDAFDYSELDAKNRAHNFELAFNTAEKMANADPLLDVEDMMIMGNRPDSKCVFTYVQSLYNKLRKFEKPLEPLSSADKKEGATES